ncbi:endoplasmic reticulum resident protein 44 isoform X1 [Bubalus kerabau]|uniref:endoplasmic reticulum resident protein 44 isoform X1 n=1 Tax=Bubalus carabanensis TaxID=3119969 RepID=UPI00244EF3FF|nr:endoplasmic reticulum resident protein 44 isoform X1 [Bubalus carabanensis]
MAQDYMFRRALREAGPGSEGVRGLSGSCPGCSPLELRVERTGSRCRENPPLTPVPGAQPFPILTQPSPVPDASACPCRGLRRYHDSWHLPILTRPQMLPASPADIAQRYRISKYPTLKLFRNGMMMKREYRGQRSVKALADYIRQQKSDPIQELHDLAEITTPDRSKRNIIGYFEQKDSENYRVFERVANILHDDCAFLAAFGVVSKPERYSGDNIVYKPPGHSAPDMVYLGSMTNFDGTYNWIQDKCVPLVREITFENGEELTEEGLPFLILFHMKEDTESLEIFQNEVARQLISEKGTINFLHADCDKFRHPLLHIQKTPADCPVIAIDSFRHMYVFGDFRDVLIPGKLKQFVFDLHSGKLHREFHHGPDPTDTAPGEEVQDVASSPPESSFQKLAPSEYRYTLLRDRDEL